MRKYYQLPYDGIPKQQLIESFTYFYP